MYLWIYPTHTNMTLVDLNVFISLANVGFLVFEIIFSQFNVHTIIRFIFILMCIIDPSRYPILQLSVLQFYLAFDFAKLFYRLLSLKLTFPMSILILCITWYIYFRGIKLFTVPMIEIPENRQSFNFWSPLNILIFLNCTRKSMQSILKIALRNSLKPSFRGKALYGNIHLLVQTGIIRMIWLQVGIVFNNLVCKFLH